MNASHHKVRSPGGFADYGQINVALGRVDVVRRRRAFQGQINIAGRIKVHIIRTQDTGRAIAGNTPSRRDINRGIAVAHFEVTAQQDIAVSVN